MLRSLRHATAALNTATWKIARVLPLSKGCYSLSQSLALWQPFDTQDRRSFSTESGRRLSFCVVGSGPAGFYTVQQLLKSFGDTAEVSLLERLPTPFGLVRSGVAPDHPETKNVIHQFTQLAADSRVRLFANVTVGTDIALSDLRQLFDGVILAYGAESNRALDIPGRHLEGIFPAREFVWWYNGHPEYCSLPIRLSEVKRAAVLGLGNVALDCARILLQPPDRLKATDIAPHALRELKHSAVEQVDVIGRRGIAQAAFTAKELREVLKLEDIQVDLPQDGMQPTELDLKTLKASRARRRVVELLQSAAALSSSGSPVEAIAGELGRVDGLKLEKMALKAFGEQQTAQGTGDFDMLPSLDEISPFAMEAKGGFAFGLLRIYVMKKAFVLKADLILESIGYRSLPIAGAPFDERSGTIPNRQGRVTATSEEGAGLLDGLYVCGWVKRGPSGIIGTNLVDAAETVQSIREDVKQGRIGQHQKSASASGLSEKLQNAKVQVVDFGKWQKIDAAEVKAGQQQGKPREKITDVSQMLAACA